MTTHTDDTPINDTAASIVESVPGPDADAFDALRPSGDPSNGDSGSVDRRLNAMTWAVGALIAIPLIVALVSVTRQHWYPTGDMAQAELHVRGFFDRPPLVGAAGRIGRIDLPYAQGSHPGPAMWVALLPTYLLLGRTSLGILIGMTVMQAAFIVAAILLARRLAGPMAALATATAAAVLVHSFGPATFLEPWNPWGALFSFMCFVIAVWGVMAGRPRWLVIAVFSGVFAVQCHIGYVPVVGAGLTGAVLAVLVRWRRDRPPRMARWWWTSVGVFGLMWVPPVVDQLRRKPGNLRILWHHFSSTTEFDGTPRVYVGLAQSLKTFAGEAGMIGPWIRGQFRQPPDPPSLALFLLTVLVVGSAVVATMRAERNEPRRLVLWLFAVIGGLMAAGIVGMSRIFGEFYGYVIRWWWILMGGVLVAFVLAAATALAGRRRAIGVIAVACVGLSGYASTATTIASAHERVPSPRNSALVGGVTDEAVLALDPAGRYLVRWYDPVSLGGIPYGVLLELERRGYTVGVDAVNSAGALPQRVMPEETASAVLWVVTGQPAIDAFRARTDSTELGFFDQRNPAEAVRSDALRAELVQRLDELGLHCLVPTLDTQYGLAPLVIGNAPVPPDVRTIAAEYNTIGLPAAVFSVPTFSPGYDVPTAGCPAAS